MYFNFLNWTLIHVRDIARDFDNLTDAGLVRCNNTRQFFLLQAPLQQMEGIIRKRWLISFK